MTFDFRKYHTRSINADSDQERNDINQELKDLYAGLNDEEKNKFNDELQLFLISQYKTLNHQVDSLKSLDGLN